MAHHWSILLSQALNCRNLAFDTWSILAQQLSRFFVVKCRRMFSHVPLGNVAADAWSVELDAEIGQKGRRSGRAERGRRTSTPRTGCGQESFFSTALMAEATRQPLGHRTYVDPRFPSHTSHFNDTRRGESSNVPQTWYGITRLQHQP